MHALHFSLSRFISLSMHARLGYELIRVDRPLSTRPPLLSVSRSMHAFACIDLVTLRDKVPTLKLWSRLGIEGVVEVMRRGRLRWFGHVERKEVDDWVSVCRNLEVAGSRGRGRSRMTWRARLDGDMKDMGLRPEMAMN